MSQRKTESDTPATPAFAPFDAALAVFGVLLATAGGITAIWALLNPYSDLLVAPDGASQALHVASTALFFWLCGWAIIPYVSYVLAEHKGRSPGGWVALTLLSGVIALAVLAVLPNLRERAAVEERRHQEILAVLRSRGDQG